MYEFLLIDLDDTVLDFHGAEAVAIRKTLADAGVAPTDAVCQRYSECNQLHWKRLERGEITREQVIVGRFQMLFDELGVAVDAAAVADNYTGRGGTDRFAAQIPAVFGQQRHGLGAASANPCFRCRQVF